MARFNASSELAKFWIEIRHGCLVTESAPVPVHHGISDIDIVAVHPAGHDIELPDGRRLSPRVIVEAKDEHDFDPKGKAFGTMLRSDVAAMRDLPYIASGTKDPIKFTMLREAHYRKATEIFGTDDFDRLFIVHAIDQTVLAGLQTELHQRRIAWLTLPDVVRDLEKWYISHPHPTGLRHSPVGDLLHLLFGYCGVRMPGGLVS